MKYPNPCLQGGEAKTENPLPLAGRTRVGVLALVITTALAVPAAASEIQLLPAYPDKPLLGPQIAKGAVIFNHGQNYDTDSDGDPPFYLDAVRDAGWDVFTLIRPVMEDREDHGPAILEDKALTLRKEGYQRIVSAGQSYGAWLSIEVAAKPGVLDAIIGTSPAHWGDQPPLKERNAEIIDSAAKMSPIPTMIFLFADDDFDPGGRGAGFRRALSVHSGAAYAVIDKPPGFVGHTPGMSMAFAAQYGHCIVAFLSAPPAPFACTPHEPTLDEVSARLPKVRQAPSKTVSVASPYIGHWYGWYMVGARETLLTIDKVSSIGRAEGSYAYGPAGHDETGGAYVVEGPIDQDGMHLKTPHSTLTYTLQPDGILAVHWSAVGGTGGAVLHRLD